VIAAANVQIDFDTLRLEWLIRDTSQRRTHA
jgi:hypothetical protein